MGLVYTKPSNNAFLTAINVVIVPFLSWKLMSKRPPAKVFAAVFVCFFGIFILTYSFDKGIVFNVGDLLTIICAFLFACHISYLGLGVQKIGTEKLTFLQMATAAVMSLAVFLIFDFNSIQKANFDEGLLPSIYLGVFNTCIAFFIQTRAQKKTSSTKAAIILSTESLFGSFFSVLLGYESLTVNLVVGGMIVLTSILMLEIDFSPLHKYFYSQIKLSIHKIQRLYK